MLDTSLTVSHLGVGTRCYTRSKAGLICTMDKNHVEKNLPHTAHGGSSALLVWTDTAHWHPCQADGACVVDTCPESR